MEEPISILKHSTPRNCSRTCLLSSLPNILVYSSVFLCIVTFLKLPAEQAQVRPVIARINSLTLIPEKPLTEPCKGISAAQSGGLICVPDDLWSSILAEDERSWARNNADVTAVDGIPVKRSGYNYSYEGMTKLWSRKRTSYMQSVWIPTLSCPQESRVGGHGDGGKWICGMERLKSISQKSDCLIYSMGSNNQYGFETALLKELSESCEVHVFDHSVKNWRLPKNFPQIHSHSYAIASQTKAEALGSPYISFERLVEKLGHQYRRIRLLKVDIEGSEYDMLPELLSQANLPDQILVELHMSGSRISSTGATDKLLYQFRNASYHMFHMEPNYACQNCNEYSFIRVDGLNRTSQRMRH